MDLQVGRSLIWAWSQGLFSSREGEKVPVSDPFLGFSLVRNGYFSRSRKVELGWNEKEASLGRHLVVQSSRSGYGPPSRAFFDLGMVPGAVFLKGEVKGSSFGIIVLVFAWSDETRQK